MSLGRPLTTDEEVHVQKGRRQRSGFIPGLRPHSLLVPRPPGRPKHSFSTVFSSLGAARLPTALHRDLRACPGPT